MKTEPGTQQANSQATAETQAAQLITANGQTYSVVPMQAVSFDGHDAFYIQASPQPQATAAAAGQQPIQLAQTSTGQTILAHPGQILRSHAGNILPNVQAVGTTSQEVTKDANNTLQQQTLAVNAVRQATSTAQTTASVAAAANQLATQFVQIGMSGVQPATIPLQIPLSTANGTVLQTIPLPVQIMSAVQAANNQAAALQVIPQLAQQVQPAQPQVAQIVLPNGQLAQVQMVTGGVGGASVGMLPLSAAAGATVTPLATSQSLTTSTWTSGTVTTPTISIPSAQTSSASVEEKGGANQQTQQQAAAAAAAAQLSSIQVQPIIQNIPGFTPVQLIPPSSLASLTGSQPITVTLSTSQTSQCGTPIPVPVLPGGAQIINTGSLQADGELGAKWVVQAAGQVNPGQIIPAEDPLAETTKTRLRRVACTCPNCKDGERPADSTKKKVHVCHIPGCNKMYGKTSHLRAHLRWHSGERPFACNWMYCNKKFTRSDELQRHKRTHTGDKRFHCEECDKRFMRSDHLSKHLKTHSKKKSMFKEWCEEKKTTIGEEDEVALQNLTTAPTTTATTQYSESSGSSDNEENILTIPDTSADILSIAAESDVNSAMQTSQDN